ncbi:hypothetical protein SAMN02745166_01506 [Prosthecobacter debontii]|uniref:Uncharacterized protein n=1 Tax=Prosthecobacter debontii TaxID=48467 RepID=A0A1T4XHB5_9BACT|nr:hypothetical protein [Prosthecobacter debontii]SKA88909.1 hypothetical protein SAMN02745166_01506 [Prosthecobacter debontii]
MPVTFETPIFALQKKDRANTSRLAPPNIASGDVEFAIIPYTLTGGTDEAAADIIKLCVLPKDVIPLPHLSSIICDADPGTAFTVDVGTADNPDGWGDGVALTTAGKVEFCAAAHTMPAWLAQTPLVPDSGSGNAEVFATVVTSTSPTAGVNVIFVLAYKRGR